MLRLNYLSDRVRKLEPKRRGRIILVDGLKGEKYKDRIPKDFDSEADLVVLIGDAHENE